MRDLDPECHRVGGPQTVVPGATAAPGNWVEMQTLRPQPRPTESETLGGGGPLGERQATAKLRISGQKVQR